MQSEITEGGRNHPFNMTGSPYRSGVVRLFKRGPHRVTVLVSNCMRAGWFHEGSRKRPVILLEEDTRQRPLKLIERKRGSD